MKKISVQMPRVAKTIKEEKPETAKKRDVKGEAKPHTRVLTAEGFRRAMLKKKKGQNSK
jgi:hypothetical protein